MIPPTFLNKVRHADGVVLIHVPQIPEELIEADTARARGYFAYPPRGLLHMAAALTTIEVPSVILDLNFRVLMAAQTPGADLEAVWRQSIDEGLARFGRPVIGLSLMFDSTWDQYKRVLEYCRTKCPDALFLGGGVAATADPQRLLEAGIDLVVLYEGEEAVIRLVNTARDGESEVAPLLNLVWREEAELARTGEEAGPDPYFDVIAEFGKLPVGDYYRAGALSNFSRMIGVDTPFATVLSRRGCRARCAFCGVRNFNGKGVRVRGAEDVVNEMAHLYDHYGVRHFDWLDDDLIYDRDAAVQLFNRMAERLPEATWAANNGIIASAVTEEILEAMQRSGCVGYKIGLESGNADVLRRMHKPTSLASFFEYADLSRRYPRMFTAVNFIMGFPGELFGQVTDSFTAAVRASLDWNNFYFYQHLRNTELYKVFGAMGGNVAESTGGEDQRPVVSLNPVRGGGFKDYNLDGGVLTGYDVVDYAPDFVPNQKQLKEVWFTFNIVANFFMMPAIATDQPERLANGIRWLEALKEAYPQDPLMRALLYYLYRRQGDTGTARLEAVRREAVANLEGSEYWLSRDRQFGFSSFLEGEVPRVDGRITAILGSTQHYHQE